MESRMSDRKKSLRLVDPELVQSLDMFPDFDLSDETLQSVREMVLPLPPSPDYGVTIEKRAIPGPPGAPDLRVLIYRPPDLDGKAPALLHIHGGGYVVGRPEMFGAIARRYAAGCNCVVISTSYRLAPETRWPGPVEDVYAALRWVHDHADELGVDPDRIAIGGESAGGGLSAALAIHARDRGGPPILFQLLIYPMLDDRISSNPYAGEFRWRRENNRYAWSALLGVPAGSDAVPSAAVPARVDDLSGLPPAYIATTSLDLFIDENLEYARRLMAAGVATGLLVVPGGYHGFDNAAPDADVSKLFAANIQQALATAFRRAAPNPISVAGA
jgi:triacylglycerol lipase